MNHGAGRRDDDRREKPRDTKIDDAAVGVVDAAITAIGVLAPVDGAHFNAPMAAAVLFVSIIAVALMKLSADLAARRL